MRKIQFTNEHSNPSRPDRKAVSGPVGIRCYDYDYGCGSGGVGALIMVKLRGSASEMAAHGRGPTDEDAITAAEQVLREDCPTAWTIYASTVLVGAEDEARDAAGVA